MSRRAGYSNRKDTSSYVAKEDRKRDAVRHFNDGVDIVANEVELDPFFSFESMESALGKQRMEIHRLVQGHHEMAMKFLARREATWRKADIEINDLRTQLDNIEGSSRANSKDVRADSNDRRADSKASGVSSALSSAGSLLSPKEAVLAARLDKSQLKLIERDEACRQAQAENFELREQLAAMQAVGATSILSDTLQDMNRVPSHTIPTWPPPQATVPSVKRLPASQVTVISSVNARDGVLLENKNVKDFLGKLNESKSGALERLERAQYKLDAWATQHHPRPNPAEVGLVDYNTLEIGTIPGTIDECPPEERKDEEDGSEDEEQEDPETFGYVRSTSNKIKKKKVGRSLGMKDSAKQMFQPRKKITGRQKTEGFAARAVRANWFENATMAAIALNTAWIGIDTSFNEAEVLYNADAWIVVGENLFCTWFFVEIMIRFMAFTTTWFAITDFWFAFDLVLVVFMIFETWVVFAIAAVGLGTGALSFDPTLLRMLRLLRITRIGRITRLLRQLPEIVILLKCIRIATRSVFFTTVLLIAMVYIFAIAMTQLAEGDFKKDYWPSLIESMERLVFSGCFADGIYELAARNFQEHVLFGLTLCAFMVCAPMTVMNLMVGILVEVVGIVASAEQEAGITTAVVEQIEIAMRKIDENNDGNISKNEFTQILGMPEVVHIFNDVSIDVVAIIRDPDIIFAGDDQLSFGEFIDEVMALRGSNPVTVKDIIQLRKQLLRELKGVVKRPAVNLSALKPAPAPPKAAWE